MSTEPKSPEKPPEAQADLAAFYRTGIKNIQRYRSKGAPMHDPQAFRVWFADQPACPQALAARLDELCGEPAPGTDPASGQDWEEFEKQARTEDPGDAMAKISKVRDWAFFQFERASKAKRKKEEKFYSDLLAKMEGTLHDAQLRAKKLGLETGDLVRRDELERPARFLAYHLLRCADSALAKLAKAIAERDPKLPPVTAQEVKALGEPLLLSALVFEPIERAMTGDNGAAPPAWLVAALKAGRDEVVE
jgi:hypothetical protein